MNTQSDVAKNRVQLSGLSKVRSVLTGDGTPSSWQERQRKIEETQEAMREKARWAV